MLRRWQYRLLTCTWSEQPNHEEHENPCRNGDCNALGSRRSGSNASPGVRSKARWRKTTGALGQAGVPRLARSIAASRARGKLQLEEAFIDASFTGQKGAYREIAQQNGIQQAEDRGVCADAEGEREHRDGSETRTLADLA
jgi:hypothetical protein